MDKRLLRAYAQTARDAGCPEDQTRLFVRGGYIAQPKQLDFHAAARTVETADGPTLLAMVGTRNSAKTHAVFAQVALDDCRRYPGLKFLFLRNFKSSAAESFDDLAAKLLRYTPHVKSDTQVRFPNGSRILIGGFKDASDINKYVGIEYDGLAIEEVNQLTKDKIEMIEGSIRTSRTDGYRARVYWTANPGGVGYSYVKQRVITPWRKEQEQGTRFFYAHWRDNVFCAADYRRYLEGLSGHLRKSWYEGDLDAFEGLAFPQFDELRHIIEPRELPYHWPRWRAVDYGLNPDPFSCLWFARDLVIGRIYIYRQARGTGYSDTIQARMIRDLTPPGEHIAMTYAGRDMWSNRDRSDGKISTNADEYMRMGVPLTMADVNRVAGKRKIDRLLGSLPDGLPGLQVFSDCTDWIATVPYLVLKPGQEDIADGQDDHDYDATRYGLTNTDIEAPPPSESAATDVLTSRYLDAQRELLSRL